MSTRGLRVLPVLGVATALVVTGCGAVALAMSSFGDDGTVRDKITAVVIDGDAGDIQIKVGSVPSATVHRDVHYASSKPGDTFKTSGGTLTLEGCGQRTPGDLCFVNYDVVLPASATVRGRTGSGKATFDHMASVEFQSGSGDIGLTNVAGDVTAKLGSGRLDMADIGGTVTADVGSGDIHGVRINGASTTVKTGSGSIELGTTSQQNVHMESGSGDATLTVPAGGYRVDLHTSSGSRDVSVPEDPSAEHLLFVHTGSGDVKVSAA